MNCKLSRACLVQLHSTDKNSRCNHSSCSGIYITPSHVLTVGSCLLPLLSTHDSTSTVSSNNFCLKNILKKDIHGSELFTHLKCSVTFEAFGGDTDKSCSDTRACVNQQKDIRLQQVKSSVRSGSSIESQHITHVGTVEYLWKCQHFAAAMKRAFPKYASWNMVENNNTDVDAAKTTSESQGVQQNPKKETQKFNPDDLEEFLAYFVIIKLEQCRENIDEKLTPIIHSNDVLVGDALSIQGTPFGSLSPSVFLNSVSHGVLCNKTGHKGELLMTDARCIPGTEGGAVYLGSHDKSKLVGIIVSPLCWKSTEWVGLSVACGITEILNSLQKKLKDHLNQNLCSESAADVSVSSLQGSQESKCTAYLSHVYDNVVMIDTRGSWGSGVLIDSRQGLILTCGHVVKDAQTVRVRFDHDTTTWLDAEVIYAQPDVVCFDIAVLKLTRRNKLHVRQYTNPVISTAYQGQPAYVIGHALFGKEHNMAASVSTGVVSTVLRRDGIPVLLQSTCAVHSGASGGPLVANSGALLGIVVCNAKDTVSGSSFPHINLSVPVSTIWPVIESYKQTKDETKLKSLEIKDDAVQRFWQLKKEEKQVVHGAKL